MIVAIGLSFTSFDTIQTPTFSGFMNYVTLFTKDQVFMQKVLPNTIVYALIVGPGGYLLSFLVAWALAQLEPISRTILTVIFYSPSITGLTAMTVLWKVIFSGDQMGYLNSILMKMGVIDEPILWLIDVRSQL